MTGVILPSWHHTQQTMILNIPSIGVHRTFKALDDRNQSILIVTSISGASLRLRPNIPTLISDFHRHIVILPMEFRRGLSRAKLFPVPSVKHNLLSHLHKYPILKYMRTTPLCPHNAHKYDTSLLRIYRCPISTILWLWIFNDLSFVDWYCLISFSIKEKIIRTSHHLYISKVI